MQLEPCEAEFIGIGDIIVNLGMVYSLCRRGNEITFDCGYISSDTKPYTFPIDQTLYLLK